MSKKQVKTKRHVLQTGEGLHTHVLEVRGKDAVEALIDEVNGRNPGVMEITLEDEAVVVHDEHDTVLMEPGTYVKTPQQEFDPYDRSTRNVFD